MPDRTKPGRLMAVVVLLATVVALSMIPSAQAAPPGKHVTGDQVRWYLLGFVDAVTGPDWAAVGARCSLQGGLFACSVRAANSSTGKSRCLVQLHLAAGRSHHSSETDTLPSPDIWEAASGEPMRRALVLGIVAAVCAGCGTPAARSRFESQVLRCMHANDWRSSATYQHSRVVELAATDGHAELELVFWATRSQARRAVPGLAPAGVGWTGSVSWRSSIGFTLADEQTVDRCLAPNRWP